MSEIQLMWVGAWGLILLAILVWWRILKYKKDAMATLQAQIDEEEEDAQDHYGEAPGDEDPEKTV